MNIEQTKEAIKVMQAFVDGKEVEVQLPAGNWETMAPNWNWRDTEYRIKPTPVLRPWTADEVPLGMQVRKKSDPTYRWVMGNTGSHDDRLKLVENHEHSTDGGKTWKECGVMEEAK
jgi:hypothetical protein